MNKLLPSGLRRSTVVTLLSWGLFFNIVSIIFQVSVSYHRTKADINSRVIEQIENALPALATSVWHVDELLLGIQLDALMYDEAIVFVQITEERGNSLHHYTRGKPETEYDFVVERPLQLNVSGRKGSDNFGHAVVFGSYKNLYNSLLIKSIESLIATSVAVFLLCLIVISTISRHIIRHIDSISSATENISIADLSTPISLRRNPGVGRPDELDRLCKAINNTRTALEEEVNRRDPISFRNGAIQLNNSDEIKDLFHRDSSYRVLLNAINHGKIYRATFGVFAIKFNNLDTIIENVGQDVTDKAVQAFAQRLQHKLKNALEHLTDGTQHGSSLARIYDDTYMAVILGLHTKVNAVSVCKRIEDVVQHPFAIGARHVVFDVNLSSLLVSHRAEASMEDIKTTLRLNHYRLNETNITAEHIHEMPIDI